MHTHSPRPAPRHTTARSPLGVVRLVVALAPLFGGTAGALDLQIDASRDLGAIRPLHGGNSGPLQYGETLDLSPRFRDLAMPLLRLHDCDWPTPDVVDIHSVFRDPSADPDLPASYDFRRTDDYLAAIVAVGSGIVYRLGESIEHSRQKYHVHPPPDPERWARVCLGIIRHYNEGWADGFHHGIRHWEIWNEPENRPAMWTGTDEDYFRLYETAARAIKSRFPDLEVGGPSLGYTGKVLDGRFEPGDFLLRFLERCRDREVPLDFFSWHLYTDDPSECLARAKGVRALLDRHGFARTESHFNEWNYLPGNDWGPLGVGAEAADRERAFVQMGGPPGAAFTAAVLSNLQDAPVDVANYYSCESHGFGFFTGRGVPKKAFFAILAFRRLLEAPVRVQALGGAPARVGVCAGKRRDGSEVRVLIGHLSSPAAPLRISFAGLPWTGPTSVELLAVDATHDLETVRRCELPPDPLDLSGDLEAPAVGLLILRPTESSR